MNIDEIRKYDTNLFKREEIDNLQKEKERYNDIYFIGSLMCRAFYFAYILIIQAF